MQKPLSIYFRASADYNASIYYRMILPVHVMKSMKLPVQGFWDRLHVTMSHAERFATMASADINLLYQIPGFLDYIKETRTWAYKQDADGKPHVPPTFVLDTDDDIFNVHPLNFSYAELGTKRHDGTLCEDGDKIWIRDPQTNEPMLLWSDGENINFAKNQAFINAWGETLKVGELITCSTPRVEQYVKREAGPEAPTYIFPNCIDFTEYPRIDLAAHPDEVRILWQGSTTHWEDLWSLREPMGRLTKKYPQVKWVFWGTNYKWLSDFIDADRVTFLSWIPYPSYKTRLATIGHDINLCPLSPHIFNQSRSAIKWYESSALTVPAATLAQTTGAYGDEMEDGKTGLLYSTPEEFEEKLDALIVDAKLRRTLGDNSKDWVKTNRDPATHVLKLYEKYCEVRTAREAWPEPVQPKQKKRRTKKGKK